MTTGATLAKWILGPAWTVRARCILRGRPLPRWGNLRRVRPFSEYFGFERGTPIDRHYLHRFLDSHRGDIRGRALEIQVSSYTRKYGHDLARTDTVDISPEHDPTYTCDLAHSGPVIPSSSYDCFLLPGTLSLLRDLEGCLREALRIVRPGGTILATTIVLGPLDPNAKDYWRLTADGWRAVAERVWNGCDVTVTSYGNCLAAAGVMFGLAAEELTPAELDFDDPRYPVLVGVRCRRSA
jgi:hypothetical protein